MTKYELYKKAYNMLDKITPLHTDCGRLCNRACCDTADEEAGMYLYPGEEVMYEHLPEWLRIEESAFNYVDSKNALVAICNGQCDRELRPLSCRVFPLVPYIKQNGVMIIKVDPRARPMCPLAKSNLSRGLNSEFIKTVDDVFKLLSEDDEIKVFITSLSKTIDEYESIINSFTGRQRRTPGRSIRNRLRNRSF